MSTHAHRMRMRLAARYSPNISVESVLPTSSSTPSSTQKSTATTPTSAPATTATPTSTTPITTSVQQSSASTIPTTTSSSSTTSSLVTSSSSSTSSSISTSSTSFSNVVSLTVLSTTPTAAVTVHTTTMGTLTGITLGTGTITSATSSATASSSGSVNTGAVVGGIAGSLAALAVIGFLVTWCIRRRRKSDEEEWSAAAFKRQSAILVDDPEPSFNPRPPTMIERHNASPALTAQRDYQNFYGGYGQQAAYGPGEIMHGGSPPPMQPHAQMTVGLAPYEDHSQLARQPSSATYLSRQPTAAGYAMPNDPQAHYVNLDRSSVTPFQAAQYADISRQLGGNPPMAPPEPLEPALMPSPFDDAAEETYPTHDAAPRALSPAHVADSHAAASTAFAPEPAPASRGRDITNAKRPDTVYTMYEEGDAYDGI